ncbi:hypothetical protein WDU94_015277, partial [Cyamophila willieti]
MFRPLPSPHSNCWLPGVVLHPATITCLRRRMRKTRTKMIPVTRTRVSTNERVLSTPNRTLSPP